MSNGNILKLNWSGATDDIGITGYELQYSLAPDYNNWTKLPIISTTNGNASYDFTIKKFISHRFSVRTIDTSGQYSDYKYTTFNIDYDSLISSKSNAEKFDICTLYEVEYVINIYSSIGSTSTIGKTVTPLIGYIVKNYNKELFYGNNAYWKISHNNILYNCKISSTGSISEINTCTVVGNSTQISVTGFSVDSSGKIVDICNQYNGSYTTVYYLNTIANDTLLFTDSTMKNSYTGDGKYHIIKGTNGGGDKIATVSSGKISNLQDQVTYCTPKNTTGPTMSPSLLSTGQSLVSTGQFSGVPSSTSTSGYMDTTQYFAFYLTVSVGAVAGCSITPIIRINGTIVWTGPTLSTKYQVSNITYYHTGTGTMTVTLEATYTGTGNSANVTMSLTPP